MIVPLLAASQLALALHKRRLMAPPGTPDCPDDGSGSENPCVVPVGVAIYDWPDPAVDAVLFGSDGANQKITGNDGDDEITAGDGDSDLYGLDGGDTLEGGDGDNIIEGGVGGDTIKGGAGDDELFGDAGIDTMYGDDDDDLMYGGDDADELHGNAGIDTIIGGEGGDTIFGGDDGDIIYGDAITGIGPAGLTYVTGSYASDGGGDDTIHGGDGDDYIFGMGGEDTIYGGSGDDIINTLTGNGLNAYTGDDEIHGESGEDYIMAGAGNDQLHGGDDDDEIFGGAGADVIRGGSGDDTLQGGDTDEYFVDVVYGDAGDDTILAVPGSNVYPGSGNNEVIIEKDTATDPTLATKPVRINIERDQIEDGTSITTVEGFTPGVDILTFGACEHDVEFSQDSAGTGLEVRQILHGTPQSVFLEVEDCGSDCWDTAQDNAHFSSDCIVSDGPGSWFYVILIVVCALACILGVGAICASISESGGCC